MIPDKGNKLKIIFICGSLKPGCDGVGDYSRRLAVAMIKQGHQAALIALCDKGLSECSITMQDLDGVTIPALRLPATKNDRVCLAKAKSYIKVFNPDWISLQYVPFSFQDKGLHFGLSLKLAQLGKGFQWHVMFHELGVGRNKNSSVQSRVFSYLQQMQIKRLVSILKPTLIHTHLPIYQLKLKQLGISARPLPLFSNISVTPGIVPEKTYNTFKFAFFSQVDTVKQILNFIIELSIQVKANGLSPELVLVGGNENKMVKLAAKFQKACPQLIKVSSTGFLNDIEISQVISGCDLGITPIPIHALGKSGSVAAFLEHGVPVAAPVVHEEYSQFGVGFFLNKEINAILINPVWAEFERAKQGALLINKRINISSILKIFYTDLVGKNG